jgi:hypothetical protein
VVGGIVVERQQVVALGEIARDEFQRRRVDDRIRQIDALFAETFGEGIAQGGLGNEAQRNQEFPDRLIRLHLLEQGDAQLILAEDALGDQDLTQQSQMGMQGRSVHHWPAGNSGRRSLHADCITAAVQECVSRRHPR